MWTLYFSAADTRSPLTIDKRHLPRPSSKALVRYCKYCPRLGVASETTQFLLRDTVRGRWTPSAGRDSSAHSRASSCLYCSARRAQHPHSGHRDSMAKTRRSGRKTSGLHAKNVRAHHGPKKLRAPTQKTNKFHNQRATDRSSRELMRPPLHNPTLK
jgi:hypothetical protein